MPKPTPGLHDKATLLRIGAARLARKRERERQEKAAHEDAKSERRAGRKLTTAETQYLQISRHISRIEKHPTVSGLKVLVRIVYDIRQDERARVRAARLVLRIGLGPVSKVEDDR